MYSSEIKKVFHLIRDYLPIKENIRNAQVNLFHFGLVEQKWHDF